MEDKGPSADEQFGKRLANLIFQEVPSSDAKIEIQNLKSAFLNRINKDVNNFSKAVTWLKDNGYIQQSDKTMTLTDKSSDLRNELKNDKWL